MSEAALLAHCKKLLHLLKCHRKLSYRRIHTGGIPKGPGRFRPNLDQRGMSDLQVYLREGITLHLELKGEKGKQSEHQKAFQEELQALGHYYHLVSSHEELIQLLRQYGVAV